MKAIIENITTSNICEYIANFARVSRVRDDKETTPEKDLAFCKRLWLDKHLTCFEAINIDFLLEDFSRVTLAQITRYRHSSPCVESQKFVNYLGKKMEFVIPEEIENFPLKRGGTVRDFIEESKEVYDEMVENKIKPEYARYVFTGATPTRMRVSMNLTEFLHVCFQRLTPHAQKETRELVAIMKEALIEMVDYEGECLILFALESMQHTVGSLVGRLGKLMEAFTSKEKYPIPQHQLLAIVEEYKKFV